MFRTIMLIPTGINVGMTSISLGLIHAMEREGIRLSVFKAITQSYFDRDISDQITAIIRKRSNLMVCDPLKMSYVASLLSSNKKDILMEKIIANYHISAQGADVVLVIGLDFTHKYQFIQLLNFEIAKVLNAEIVFVTSHGTDTLKQLKNRIKLTYNIFSSIKNSNATGVIINKLNAPVDERWCIHFDSSEISENSSKTKAVKIEQTNLQISNSFPILGAIPWRFDLISARAIDIARHLNAVVINQGDINTRRITSIIFCQRSISHTLKYFRNGSLLVITIDRLDMLVAVCLAAINGAKIGAILLTDSYEIDYHINNLCERAFFTGLPVFMVNTNTWQTSLNLQSFNSKIQVDDDECIEKVQEHVANYINTNWIKSLTITFQQSRHLSSPPAFCYQLTEMARKINKCIVLPEGNEPRIIKAATICAERGIATCVLLGNPDEISCIATSYGIKLNSSIEIINPVAMVRESYVARLVELRKDKGMTEAIARKQLEENVMLGTLMLEQNKVDGLVSGVVHTTANTIRPSLQLIKTAPGSSLISSVFFMLLPEQVYVYGDCAINPNPTIEQLAEIAIQSADSALAFGIEPRVAMLSYSTGTSGVGNDVEKVRKATLIAQEKRPDLMIDGPIQYDAAVMPDVAKFKAPHSPVAGRATVFIFPDLNSGNITYKAVQRSANLISIGPMLQGIRKAVNDLSRGALVEDIIYTIALTAIQSSQKQ